MQLLFRALRNRALQVHVAKDNSIVGDDPSSERIEELWVVHVVYIYRKMELRYWLVHANLKNNTINLLHENTLRISIFVRELNSHTMYVDIMTLTY